MFYDFALTVTADTKEATPVTEELDLCYGIIHRVEVGFPAGCHGMVKIKIFRNEHQAFPTNPDGYLAADKYTIGIDESFDLTVEPFKLKVVGYSPDTIFDHAITIRIGILESSTAIFFMKAIEGLVKMLKLVGINV